jgi:hypothetical protein
MPGRNLHTDDLMTWRGRCTQVVHRSTGDIRQIIQNDPINAIAQREFAIRLQTNDSAGVNMGGLNPTGLNWHGKAGPGEPASWVRSGWGAGAGTSFRPVRRGGKDMIFPG